MKIIEKITKIFVIVTTLGITGANAAANNNDFQSFEKKQNIQHISGVPVSETISLQNLKLDKNNPHLIQDLKDFEIIKNNLDNKLKNNPKFIELLSKYNELMKNSDINFKVNRENIIKYIYQLQALYGIHDFSPTNPNGLITKYNELNEFVKVLSSNPELKDIYDKIIITHKLEHKFKDTNPPNITKSINIIKIREKQRLQTLKEVIKQIEQIKNQIYNLTQKLKTPQLDQIHNVKEFNQKQQSFDNDINKLKKLYNKLPKAEQDIVNSDMLKDFKNIKDKLNSYLNKKYDNEMSMN